MSLWLCIACTNRQFWTGNWCKLINWIVKLVLMSMLPLACTIFHPHAAGYCTHWISQLSTSEAHGKVQMVMNSYRQRSKQLHEKDSCMAPATTAAWLHKCPASETNRLEDVKVTSLFNLYCSNPRIPPSPYRHVLQSDIISWKQKIYALKAWVSISNSPSWRPDSLKAAPLLTWARWIRHRQLERFDLGIC